MDYGLAIANQIYVVFCKLTNLTHQTKPMRKCNTTADYCGFGTTRKSECATHAKCDGRVVRLAQRWAMIIAS